MPELAEVEYYRRQWDCGLRKKVRAASAHVGTRVFQPAEVQALARLLRGKTLLGSEARGKQMLFRFSGQLWLGMHLGMTGQLLVKPARHRPGRHDHLVLFQAGRALVFSDPRQFGRVRLHRGPEPPAWWRQMPPPLTSDEFTPARMRDFLQRHRRLPLKAALLLQRGFPGIGNWMADEILWRAGLHPRTPAGAAGDGPLTALWRHLRFVCRGALRTVARDYSDPPRGWFFHERWGRDGRCPRDGAALRRDIIGGRTTAWCPRCQPGT